MTTANESGSSRSYVRSLLPWILAAGMMVVYLFTLQHSYTLGNFRALSEVSGWNLKSNPTDAVSFGPISFLVTYPFRLLPVKALPLALNLFSAFCGALVLALLARSVALLPHDRTQEQRQRELSEYSLLTIKTAWIPPLLAVLVCGLQMTFWENAMQFTGDMVDLLIFAYCIRCVLEYRIEQKESWLVKFSLVCGLGMANNWAMIGYLPAFLVALVWIKGPRFFNLRLMLKMMGLGLIGFLFIILLPLKASIVNPEGGGFFKAMKFVLAGEKFYLWNSWHYFPKETLLVLCLPFLLPLILIGIRWSSFFGDTSRFGIFLATTVFHIVHALFLGACLWVALDPPFSPRQSAYLVYGFTPFSTFYYLGALNVGYFVGYFLLIFGKKVSRSRHRPHPAMKLVNRVVVVAVCSLVIVVPALLICRNLPKIRSVGDGDLERYYDLVEQSLPKKGAVILGDNSAQLLLLEAHLSQHGKAKEYLLIDTSAITDASYFKRLIEKYPEYRLLRNGRQYLDSMGLISLLGDLSKDYEIFYLNPSLGYFFEEFYGKSEGLVYKLRSYPISDSLIEPPPTDAEITAAQDFWKKLNSQGLDSLIQKIEAPGPESTFPIVQRIFDSLHLTREKNIKNIVLGGYYSAALDYLGVTLQKAGRLDEAAKYFEQAQRLNPENVSAQVNSQFNKDLAAGKKAVIAPPKAIEDKFGKFREWTNVLKQDGPFDEPNFCYELGVSFVRGRLLRQSIQQFERVLSLDPENTNSRLWLAQLYLTGRVYSNALASANSVLEKTPNEPDALFLKGAIQIQMKDYENALVTLNQLLTLEPNNFGAKLNRAIAYFQSGNLDAAKVDYESVTSVAPKAYQAYFGLAEIAYRKKDNPAAADYYRHYLTNAPPNTEEVKMVKSRLKELGAGSP